MITHLRGAFVAVAVCLGLLLSAGQGHTQTAEYRQDRILIKPSVTPTEALAALHGQLGTTALRSFPRIGNIQVVQLPSRLTVQQAIAAFENSGLVIYAEPDYLAQTMQVFPNDPRFVDGTLWGLHNTGQNGGVADADIDAPEGWARRNTANHVIVAVIDTGIRYTHQDLAANMWINPGEIAGNGIDASEFPCLALSRIAVD